MRDAHRSSERSLAEDALLTLLVDALATYRLTRLATADVITEPARRFVVGQSAGVSAAEVAEEHESAEQFVSGLSDAPKLARLVTCRWCAGVWIAGGVVAARRVAPRAWDPVARALALSAAAVLAARAET